MVGLVVVVKVLLKSNLGRRKGEIGVTGSPNEIGVTGVKGDLGD
jgi:hypothetical protein